MSDHFAAALGLPVPILQAPMAGVQDAGLAVAVARAGALGAIPAAMLTPDTLAAQLQRFADGAPGCPVNVNFFCHHAAAPEPAGLEAWQQRLDRYAAELGVDRASAAGPVRAPFDAAMAAVIERFRPQVVSFHFGLPAAPLLARVRATGARVIASATTVAEAGWLVARGVDAVIAQGLQAGGHRGSFLAEDLALQAPMLPLVRAIVAAIDRPVIAAGGIASATEVRAALAAGAQAVQVGTALLCAEEATTSPLHRAALASLGQVPTAVTNVFTGRPARGMVNRLVRELGPLALDAPPFPHAAAPLAALRAAAEARGSTDFTPLWAGDHAQPPRHAPAAGLLAALAEGVLPPR